jgi:transcriptional regulator with XRE-family HTH domain
MTITEKIIALRTKLKIKSSEIAYALEMNHSNYLRIEKRDKELSINQLESIAVALGVTIDDILHYGEKKVQTIDNEEIIREKKELESTIRLQNEFIKTLETNISLVRKSRDEMITKEKKDFEFAKSFIQIAKEQQNVMKNLLAIEVYQVKHLKLSVLEIITLTLLHNGLIKELSEDDCESIFKNLKVPAHQMQYVMKTLNNDILNDGILNELATLKVFEKSDLVEIFNRTLNINLVWKTKQEQNEIKTETKSKQKHQPNKKTKNEVNPNK